MKKFIMTFVLCSAIFGTNYAQEDQQNATVYTFVVNIANEQFRYPLFGFVNVAWGSHAAPQIGFVNWNQNDFSGLQFGFVNMAGGNTYGLQMGFVNTTANGIEGAQISFVNVAKHLRGLQLGFVNYVDSIEQGIPLGFVSIVQKGGYRALEAGASAISPFNLSFKIGLERLYTSFVVSCNPFEEDLRRQVLFGVGIGGIIRLNEKFFINPEIVSQNVFADGFQEYASFFPAMGYAIIPQLSILAGPSITWVYAGKDRERIFYVIGKYSINDNNTLYFGTRVAVRFSW
jgi:hypothetical protein